MEIKDAAPVQTDSNQTRGFKFRRSNKKSSKSCDPVLSKSDLESEIERDAEYRRLNATLREKENEIKMLESKKNIEDLTYSCVRK
jgi:hypothetical protein